MIERTPLRLVLPTAAATQRVGARLGALLQPGDVLGLDGPLGAGKTCFVQGLARGLGVPEEVAVGSPTFTLINQYQGRVPLWHVDLYRLGDARELPELGLWELSEGGGVLAVEWLSRFPDAVPGDRLALVLSLAPLPARGTKAARTRPRTLHLTAGGPQAQARLEALRAQTRSYQLTAGEGETDA